MNEKKLKNEQRDPALEKVKKSKNKPKKKFKMNIEEWVSPYEGKEKKDEKEIKSNPDIYREKIGGNEFLFRKSSDFKVAEKVTFLDLSQVNTTSKNIKDDTPKIKAMILPTKRLESLVNFSEKEMLRLFPNESFQVLINRSGVVVLLSKTKTFGINFLPLDDSDESYTMSAWFRTINSPAELVNATLGFIIESNDSVPLREVRIIKKNKIISVDEIIHWFERNKHNIYKIGPLNT